MDFLPAQKELAATKGSKANIALEFFASIGTDMAESLPTEEKIRDISQPISGLLIFFSQNYRGGGLKDIEKSKAQTKLRDRYNK